MNFRTDLAMESAENDHLLGMEDITQTEEEHKGGTVLRMVVRSEKAAARLQKPVGTYITINFPPLSGDETAMEEKAELVAKELTALLPSQGTVLVAGLGNRTVTPDALGPATAERVLATRHIRGEFARVAGLDDLRPVAVLTPGVLGQTGTESVEILRGVCGQIHPAVVIVIDALAARKPQRLGTTVQISDAGIAPGSGVGNNRRAISKEALGIPVIGIGVPTVVDATALVGAYVEEPSTVTAQNGEKLMVTPREIDLVIGRASRLLGLGINKALQPAYSATQLITIAAEQ